MAGPGPGCAGRDVDGGEAALDNEAARRYGLVNVERCEEIIEQRKKGGYAGRSGRTEL